MLGAVFTQKWVLIFFNSENMEKFVELLFVICYSENIAFVHCQSYCFFDFLYFHFVLTSFIKSHIYFEFLWCRLFDYDFSNLHYLINRSLMK